MTTSWPAAGERVETEHNPHVHMSEFEPERLAYRMTMPARIAELAIPQLDATANRELGDADRAMAALAHATVEAGLSIGSLLVGVLIRLEAVSSSQIEDLDADVETSLVRHHADLAGEDAETALVQNNIDIVAASVTSTLRLSSEWLCELHRDLMAGSDLLAHHIGAFRDCPVWIGRTRATAEFEGPPHGEIDAAIGDLIAFANRADIHPIVQAAIAHSQFETIHPFVDGNGRIGRALLHPILRRVAPSAIVPASHALLARRAAYFDGLTRYRDGDLNGWVSEFATAVATAAEAATGVTTGLAALSRSWQEEIQTNRDGTASAILASLPTNPVVTIASARALRNTSQPAALSAVSKLVDAGILRQTTVKTSGRAHVWVAGGVMDVLASLDRTIGQRH